MSVFKSITPFLVTGTLAACGARPTAPSPNNPAFEPRSASPVGCTFAQTNPNNVFDDAVVLTAPLKLYGVQFAGGDVVYRAIDGAEFVVSNGNVAALHNRHYANAEKHAGDAAQLIPTAPNLIRRCTEAQKRYSHLGDVPAVT